MVRGSTVLLIAFVLAACGQADRVVDDKGAPLSEKTLKSAEASMKASKVKRTPLGEQADQIVRQAAFQRSLGKEVKITKAQMSILARAEAENVDAKKMRVENLVKQLKHARMQSATAAEKSKNGKDAARPAVNPKTSKPE